MLGLTDRHLFSRAIHCPSDKGTYVYVIGRRYNGHWIYHGATDRWRIHRACHLAMECELHQLLTPAEIKPAL